MKKNLVILFLILLTVVNIAALVTFAYHRFHPRPPLPLMHLPDKPENFIRRELDLNEEQMTQFEAHFNKFKMEMDPILDSLRAKRAELSEEMATGEPSVAKLDGLAEEIGALEVRLQKKTITHMLETKAFLNPDQQKKFFLLFKEGQDRARGPANHGRMDQDPRGSDFNDHR
jgi:Spy/CpxP family protein refolding chaperone